MTVLPEYRSKREALSDAQTVALAGCGKWKCLSDRPGRSPELCRECVSLYEKLLLIAAYWPMRKLAV